MTVKEVAARLLACPPDAILYLRGPAGELIEVTDVRMMVHEEQTLDKVLFDEAEAIEVIIE